MEFITHLPVWDKLTASQQELFKQTVVKKFAEKGTAEKALQRVTA